MQLLVTAEVNWLGTTSGMGLLIFIFILTLIHLPLRVAVDLMMSYFSEKCKKEEVKES